VQAGATSGTVTFNAGGTTGVVTVNSSGIGIGAGNEKSLGHDVGALHE